MDNKKMTGILWIFVVITVFSALTITLVFDITLNTGDMEKTLRNLSIHPGAHICELILDTGSNIFLIMAALMLYRIFGRSSRALFGTIWFMISGIIMIVHNMGNFAVTWIAFDYSQAVNQEAMVLLYVAKGMLLTAKWGVTLASFFFVTAVIVYCSLIVKISKIIGLFGIAAGIPAVPALSIAWMGPQYEMLSYRLWGPMLIWQIVFGFWLIFSKRKTDIQN